MSAGRPLSFGLFGGIGDDAGRLRPMLARAGVRDPLFHASGGMRVIGMLRTGAILAQSGHSHFGGQAGISLTRNLAFALGGNFGNHILVFDRGDLRARFRLVPRQHPIGDEYEERLQAERLPLKFVRALVINANEERWRYRELREIMPFPVVARAERGAAWVWVKEPV